MKRNPMRTIWLALLLVAGVSLAAAQQITAAGATFPAPIYQKWFGEYHKLHPDIEINYQSIGSGAGIQQLTAGTVDFGASDMPMTDEQISKIKTHPLHFPTVLGAVVPTYNISGVTADLKFSGETLAGIFLGKIKKWNDPALAKENPGIKLPGEEIVVVHRSDGSGTTFVWTDFLSKVSPEWKSKVGANTSVSWPAGLGGKGSEGVTGAVKQTPNSIGYVELLYAAQNKLPYGSVKNPEGTFVKASIMSVSEAAAGAAKNMPADFRVSITNAPGKNAYPISTFTWLLIPTHIPDAKKAAAIKGFLQWMSTEGQKDAGSLDYAPLPKEVVAKETKQIADIK
ncbi:MAG: phosphate ABC transporter substrate-binding protein PstS [Terriglobia bacterium]|nr:MAG: phosphate ABC transporter substrate-binding protein PstS [Terriglobia bacterium]